MEENRERGAEKLKKTTESWTMSRLAHQIKAPEHTIGIITARSWRRKHDYIKSIYIYWVSATEIRDTASTGKYATSCKPEKTFQREKLDILYRKGGGGGGNEFRILFVAQEWISDEIIESEQSSTEDPAFWLERVQQSIKVVAQTFSGYYNNSLKIITNY